MLESKKNIIDTVELRWPELAGTIVKSSSDQLFEALQKLFSLKAECLLW